MNTRDTEVTYAFVYRSATIRGDTPQIAIDMLGVRLDARGPALG